MLFSDEYAQSFLVPRVDTDVVLDALDATPNLKFYVFAERNSRVWDNYAQHGNGSVFQLSRNQQQMYSDLMSILDEICLASSGQDASNSVPSGFMNVNEMIRNSSYGSRYDHNLGLCW